MTTQLPAATPAPDDSPEGAVEGAGFVTVRADAVLAGRAMSSGEFLAGVLAAGELDTAGAARKLPADLWPDVDPVVVQEIWDRAVTVAWRAAQFAGSGWLYRDRLQDVQARLTEAGFHAMGGMVARSLGLVAPSELVHPVEGEMGREHG